MIDLSKVEPQGCELTHHRIFKFPGTRTMHTVRAGLDKDGMIWFSINEIYHALGVSDTSKIVPQVDECNTRMVLLNRRKNGFYPARGISAAGLLQAVRQLDTPRARALWQWYMQTVKPAMLGDKAPQPDAQLTFDEADKLDEVQTPAAISVETKPNQRIFTFGDKYKIRAVLDDNRNIWLIAPDVFNAFRRTKRTHAGSTELERVLTADQFKRVMWQYGEAINGVNIRLVYAVNKQGLYALAVKRMRMENPTKSAIAQQFWQWFLDVVEPAMLKMQPEENKAELFGKSEQLPSKPEAKKPDELIISKVKLQPCPECGTQPEIKACRVAAADGKPEHYCSVECPSCHFTVMERGTSPQQAMQRWNETADKLNKPKLKPCPHCGGDKVRVISACSCSMKYYVLCEKCFALFGGFDTPEAAADAWNRRA